ncbi:hypothetical protein GOV14_06270 [Candidatus Pacearchaeota archaeon]|nr:hypothetical protein [Candidatus Pacearchaeota archaeon]
MVIQDLVITVANLIFTYALIIQVFHGFRTQKISITIQTSVLTSIGLYATGIAFLTLGLTYSGLVCSFNGIMWTTFLIQKIVYKN